MSADERTASEHCSPALSPPGDRNTLRAFVAIAMVFGTLLVILTPAFTGYDEPYHYVRAWQLSNVQVHSVQYRDANGQKDLGAYFPGTLYVTMFHALLDGYYASAQSHCHGASAACAFGDLDEAAPHGPKTLIGFPSAAVYPPVPYIPSAAAIRVARGLGLSTLATLWLARFAGLVAYVLLVSFALVRIPRWRGVLAIVALTPVCVFQAAMVSADGLTIALALLAIAMAMRLASERPEISATRALVEVGLLGAALGLSKPPYILFLLLFVPAVIRHRHALLGRLLPVVMLPGVALFAWWSHYTQSVWLPPVSVSGTAGALFGFGLPGADASRQLTFVEHHPLHFLNATATTVGHTWTTLAHDAVAQVSGWVSTPVALAVGVALLSYAALVLAVVGDSMSTRTNDGAPRSSSALEIVTDVVVAFGTFLALFLLAYTGWNPVGGPRVDAFQGRYLVPVLALLVIGVAPRLRVAVRAGPGPSAATLTTAAWLLVVAALVTTTLGLTLHYY